MNPTSKTLPRLLELTAFSPVLTRADLEKICAEAREHNYHALCVNGSRVELARTLLEDSDTHVVALIGFPFGASDADAKRYEIEIALDHGAHELDVVLNLGRLKEGDHQYLLRELRDLAEAADERPVKAILETHLLTREEIILAAQIALDSGIQYVATATDFHTPEATIKEVKLLRETLGETIGIKAAGQIRETQPALRLLEAGATRLAIQPGTDLLGGLVD